MGLVARTEDIFFGTPMGRSSDRTTMAVVAEINNDADRYLRMIVNGRPLAGSAVRKATWNWRWYIRPKVGACTSGLLVHGK